MGRANCKSGESKTTDGNHYIDVPSGSIIPLPNNEVNIGGENFSLLSTEHRTLDVVDEYGMPMSSSLYGHILTVDIFRPFVLKIDGYEGKITIPTISGSIYDYSVSVSDDQLFYNKTGDLLITFTNGFFVDYFVSIYNTYPHFKTNSIPSAQRNYIKEITQWGDIEWGSMDGIFSGADFLITATDIPNTSSVTSYYDMMYNSDNINIDFTGWDFTSAITLSWMFSSARGQTKDVKLYTPNVTNITFIASNSENLKVLELDCTSVTSVNATSFNSVDIERLILTNMSISFSISNTPSLTGSMIDDLASSVKDFSGSSPGTGPSITMTPSQYFSCDFTIWTTKNWTIVY